MLTDQLTPTALGVLLHAAEAAPGLHVPRPWRVEVNGHLIDVYLDEATADAVARIQRVATGAAVFNLRCAAASLSFDSWVSLYPYPHEPGLAARIVVEPTGLPDLELQELYAAILSRHLARPPRPPDQQDRRMLERAAAIEDANLTWLPVDSLAVVVTHGAEPADQLQAGIALQRVLLTATSRDVRADCLNHTLIRFGERTERTGRGRSS
ncbi:hypothetical protein [Kribbella sindirgiensis]|uniref:Uncharacterized protein n=1 Tax=Kribbella sindirgiensis TaxID=1124744 RepID=A0A4R0I3H7_9ACTN|nr:hypothetical protein [Kribbella sindirgiensis]TCC21563.1 hypothetical protein E0H50_35345 [Kribbella sindirgiensis]